MSKNSRKHVESLKIPKFILITTRLISLISTKWLVRFTATLFTTPVKYKIPNREMAMDHNSIKEFISVPKIDKQIMVYKYGTGQKKILLAHGWSGRGTQLVKIADQLVLNGYTTISFDAPAHGKSDGKTTLLPEFIDSILEINKIYGPFDAAIGHSLGAMSLINALNSGLQINKLVIIGSGDIIKDIFDEFVEKLKLKHKISDLLKVHFEEKSKLEMDSFSAYRSAKSIEIPVLVIHDHDDPEVHVKSAIHIHKHLKNAELMITKNLGHRKILGDSQVIEKTLEFINI